MEGITSPVRGKSNSIKTFRNALGIDSFAGSGRIKATVKLTTETVKLVTLPTTPPTTKPTTQPIETITQPTTPPTTQPTAKPTTH